MAKSIIKGYKILKKIGQGGMAAIYLAEHLATGQRVALKVLLSHIASDRDYVLRFLHEVRANKKLNNTHIVRIMDCDEVKGHYFMAMEYVDGMTLQQVLQMVPTLPLSITLSFIHQILEGLQYSHSRLIVHRDMKPSNILIDSQGVAKISDFGISKTTNFTKLTQTGSVLGTPAYMSPEQATGKAVDARSDIFSTGIMFYEMLIGHNPFQSDNPSTTILNILQKTPPSLFELNPTYPSRIEMIVERMIQKDIEKRYRTVPEVLDELDNYLKDNPSIAPAPEDLPAFMSDPVATTERLSAEEARRIVKSAREKMAQSKENINMVLWEFYRAMHLRPDDMQIRQEMESLCRTKGYNIETSKTRKILELEQALDDDPENITYLLQLAKLNRLENNFFEVIKYFKKLKKLKPQDAYIQGQIDALFNDRTLVRELTAAYRVSYDAKTASQVVGMKTVSAGKRSPRVDLVTVAIPPRAKKSKKLFPIVLILCIGVSLFFGARYVLNYLDTTAKAVRGKKMKEQMMARLQAMADPNQLTADQLAMYKKAEEAFKEKNYERAAKLFNTFLTTYPGKIVANVRLRLIQINEKLQQYDKALMHIDKLKAVSDDPLIIAYVTKEKARIFSIEGNFMDAEQEYESLLLLLDDIDDKDFCVDAMLEYAKYLRGRKRFEDALVLADRVITNYSGVDFINQARLFKADIYQSQGRIHEARAQLKLVKQNCSPADDLYDLVQRRIEALGGNKNKGSPRSSDEDEVLGEVF